jgi:hypothetical protein
MSDIVVQQQAKKGLSNWGKVNLWHVVDDEKVSERERKLCLMKSVVDVAMFV